MPKGFGTEPHRRSRSSIGSTSCRTWATPWSGSFSAIAGTSTAWARHSIELQSQRPRLRPSARRVTPDGCTCTTKSSGCTLSTWELLPSHGRSRSVARPFIGISPCPSRPSGSGHVIVGSPSSRPSPRMCDGGGTPVVAMPNSSGGSSWRRGTGPARRTVERYVGQLRRETGSRFKFRQAAPAPLYAEDQNESRPAPLTALRAARLFLSKPGDRRSTDQALLAHLLRVNPVMPLIYRQVQTFSRMIRERRGYEFDAWVAEVQQTGIKELRGFVQGLLKDEAAVRAGLSLVWSNGPTEGFIHRLKLIKRQAYGRAGVDFLRHRILPSSAGMAA
jgi:hypothetical protein